MRDNRSNGNVAFGEYDFIPHSGFSRSFAFSGPTAFVGTPGNDLIEGTDGRDAFDMTQGGDDVVSGSRGRDSFRFGATYTGADRVDGGEGRQFDSVILRGDYSAGIDLQPESLLDVEMLVLKGGPFVITGAFAGVFQSGLRSIDASSLDEEQSLTMSVSGGGNEVFLTSGAGDDVLDFSDFVGIASVMGGAGNDTISAIGDSISGDDGNDILDALSGSTDLSGGNGDDILIGGSEDYFSVLNGGPGADMIEVNNRSTQILYESSYDSAGLIYDTVNDFDGKIILAFDSNTVKAGDQHNFHIGETDNRIGDIVFRYDMNLDRTIVDVFTDRDSNPDFTVHLVGNISLTANNFDTTFFT